MDVPFHTVGADPLAVLEELLAQADEPVAALTPVSARTAPAWRERALEALLREDLTGAVDSVEAGLAAPGADEPGVRLALLRLAATAAAHQHDDAQLTRWLGERASLLRGHGHPHQADLETQLGASLLREPDGFEAAVLAGVVARERERLGLSSGSAHATPAPGQGDIATGDTALPDVLLALCAHRIQDGALDEALEAAQESIAVLRALRAAGALLPVGVWPHAHLMLARLHLWRGEAAEAESAATTVLTLPAARVVRASAVLVRALAAHELGRHEAALAFALEAAARMAETGLRRGAASAAALAGRVAGTALDSQDVAVTAWRLAAVHAEKAEAPEASSLSYWWAHQLVLAGRPDEAEPVLDTLVRREAAHGNDLEQARALVDLGHALLDQDRGADALPLWCEAAALFEHHGEHADAAHSLLAAGALVNREREGAVSADALTLFQRAADAARHAADEDPALLAAALHALGYLRCETGRGDGLALLDEALGLARESGSAWQVADFTDTRARSLWALEQSEEAVATALRSSDLFTAAGDLDGAAQAELFAASVLAESGRPQEAATLFRLVSEATGSDLVRLGALSGLHRCLSALGDHAEAARVRADADLVRRALGVSDA